MSKVLDFMDALNWIDRVEGAVARLVHADWHGVAQKHGAIGVLSEFGRSVVAANQWSFHAPRSQAWSGTDMERLLNRYGIVIWERRVTSQHYIFSVKERQANWAEYLLLRRGIALDPPLFNPNNAGSTARYAPGDQPPAWADRSSGAKTSFGRFLDWLG